MSKVIVLGGGVAGMSAAQELAERGFEVEVYERQENYVGGKARSINVPDTNTQNPDKYLPGEHGFRFFPGFYKHVTDSMKRIPTENGKSTFDNLVNTDTVEICQIGKLPLLLPMHFPTSVKDFADIIHSMVEGGAELSKQEIAFFTGKVWQLMTSCKERFLDEYESIGWWEFLEADRFSKAYQELLVEGLTRSLVAAQAQTASTRTVGTIFLQLIYTMISIGNKNTDRVLNNPTNDAWLNPWFNYLKSLNVQYNHHHQVISFEMENNRISGVNVKNLTTETTQLIKGDYYILATPVEVAAQLISKEMIKVDASLQNIIKLAPNTAWMNGAQFYLNQQFDMHKGHTIYAGSNWALTSISQIQFWNNYDLSDRYNGKVKGILSVDISDWTAPGNFNNKAAKDCTREEVIEEVWKQLKQEINVGGKELLTDDMLEFSFLDDDIQPEQPDQGIMRDVLSLKAQEEVNKLSNKEPLLVNIVDSWGLRPNSYTNIPNLFLASDYIKTYTDLATMEGANEAARRAVNNILRDSGSKKKLCELWKLDSPLLLDALQLIDKKNFSKGLSWKKPL
jgi:uncharacterized protein with NAD-binding domain and iron-sulfur cluster